VKISRRQFGRCRKSLSQLKERSTREIYKGRYWQAYAIEIYFLLKRCELLFAIESMFFGQSEAKVTIKEMIDEIDDSIGAAQQMISLRICYNPFQIIQSRLASYAVLLRRAILNDLKRQHLPEAARRLRRCKNIRAKHCLSGKFLQAAQKSFVGSIIREISEVRNEMVQILKNVCEINSVTVQRAVKHMLSAQAKSQVQKINSLNKKVCRHALKGKSAEWAYKKYHKFFRSDLDWLSELQCRRRRILAASGADIDHRLQDISLATKKIPPLSGKITAFGRDVSQRVENLSKAIRDGHRLRAASSALRAFHYWKGNRSERQKFARFVIQYNSTIPEDSIMFEKPRMTLRNVATCLRSRYDQL